MPLFITATLTIVGLVAAVAFVAGLLVAGGLLAWDLASARSHATSPATAQARWTPEEAERRISIERGIARAFVIVGGTFWGIAVFMGLYTFSRVGIAWSLLGAFIPFVATLAALIVGWYYERVAAIALWAATLGVVAWGVSAQFEMGVWVIVTITLIGPMVTAATLFWLARRNQDALEMSLARQPELATVSAADEMFV